MMKKHRLLACLLFLPLLAGCAAGPALVCIGGGGVVGYSWRKEHRNCPYCDKLIERKATTCPYCGKAVEPILKETEKEGKGGASACVNKIN